MRPSVVVAATSLSLCFVCAPLALGQANQPPNAVIRTNPAPTAEGAVEGYSPLTVTFNACRSSDSDPGDQLRFLFDLDADGTLETFGDCRQTVTYHAAQMAGRAVTVCVTDRVAEPGHQICRSFYLFHPPRQEPDPGSATATPPFLHAFTTAPEFYDLFSSGFGDTPSDYHRIQATGSSALVGSTGAIGVRGVDRSGGGLLYAVARADASGDSGEVRAATHESTVLVEIDPATGLASEVGPTNEDDFADLAFSPGGVLFGLKDGYELWSINAATGAATLVDELEASDLAGIAFVAGVLYAVNYEGLFTFTVGDPDATSAIELDFAADLPCGCGYDLTGLDAGPGGMLYASMYSLLDTDEDKLLVKIDPATGKVTRVATLPQHVLSLTWSE